VDYTTITYDVADHVATVTLNRPDRLNAFNQTMCDEFSDVWQRVRTDDNVHVVVLRAAGDRAFCTGIDVREPYDVDTNVWSQEDPGRQLSPKQNRVWKPVVAAVHGMAAGGAFYWLNESDIIICSDDATFFDPHVSYGMVAGFETVHLLQKVPFGEMLRIALLGGSERMSAERAHQIGLVSEIAPAEELMDRAMWVAQTIASAPALAIQGTLRSAWMAHEHFRRDAIAQISMLVSLGTTYENIQAGQESFHNKREKPRVR